MYVSSKTIKYPAVVSPGYSMNYGLYINKERKKKAVKQLKEAQQTTTITTKKNDKKIMKYFI